MHYPKKNHHEQVGQERDKSERDCKMQVMKGFKTIVKPKTNAKLLSAHLTSKKIHVHTCIRVWQLQQRNNGS